MYRFDPQRGREILEYGSRNVSISNIIRLATNARISYMHLGANGIIGHHQAAIPQLFLVVEGEGWVRSKSPQRTPITKGQAAFWERNEWHESGTDTGMTAVVIESENLSRSELGSGA